MARIPITATLQMMGDAFPHAWFFNSFRCDPLGSNILVTTALLSQSGGTPAVNGFVISQRDLDMTKDRAVKYIGDVGDDYEAEEAPGGQLLAAPSRVYPVNYINISRVDSVGELCLYRYAMNTLLNVGRPSKTAVEKAAAKGTPVEKSNMVPCYPVVMLRSELSIQIALLSELFGK